MEHDKKTYTLEPGEALFIEGKHGIIHIAAFDKYVKVTANVKTDAERA